MANIDDYQNDLARLLAADDVFDADWAALKGTGEENSETSALTAIARVADRDLQLLLDDPLYDAMELLNVTWGRTRFKAQMAHGYRVFDHDTGQVYGTILASRGREPRPPLDWTVSARYSRPWSKALRFGPRSIPPPCRHRREQN